MVLLLTFLPLLQPRKQKSMEKELVSADKYDLGSESVETYVVQNDPLLFVLSRIPWGLMGQYIVVTACGGGIVVALSVFEGTFFPNESLKGCLSYKPGFWLCWFVVIPMGLILVLRYLRALPKAINILQKGKNPIIKYLRIPYRNRRVFENWSLTTWTFIIVFFVTYSFQEHQNRGLNENSWGLIDGQPTASKMYFTIACAVLISSLALTTRKMFYNILFLRKTFSNCKLNLNILDHHRCGGLAPIGSFCLSSVWIVTCIAVTIIVAMAARTVYQGQSLFNFQTCVTLTFFLLLAPIVFFGPAVIVRSSIIREKKVLYDYFEHKLKKLQNELGARIPSEEDKRKLKDLEEHLERIEAVSLWPYSQKVLRVFGMQLTIALASALIVKAIAVILKRFC